MQTQLKTSVKGIAVELSLSEALLFLQDPTKVQTEVRIMLRNADVNLLPDPTKAGEREPCPHCGKGFLKLNIHLARGCPELK